MSCQSTGHYSDKQNFAFSQHKFRCHGNLAIDSHPTKTIKLCEQSQAKDMKTP